MPKKSKVAVKNKNTNINNIKINIQKRKYTKTTTSKAKASSQPAINVYSNVSIPPSYYSRNSIAEPERVAVVAQQPVAVAQQPVAVANPAGQGRQPVAVRQNVANRQSPERRPVAHPPVSTPFSRYVNPNSSRSVGELVQSIRGKLPVVNNEGAHATEDLQQRISQLVEEKEARDRADNERKQKNRDYQRERRANAKVEINHDFISSLPAKSIIQNIIKGNNDDTPI